MNSAMHKVKHPLGFKSPSKTSPSTQSTSHQLSLPFNTVPLPSIPRKIASDSPATHVSRYSLSPLGRTEATSFTTPPTVIKPYPHKPNSVFFQNTSAVHSIPTATNSASVGSSDNAKVQSFIDMARLFSKQIGGNEDSLRRLEEALKKKKDGKQEGERVCCEVETSKKRKIQSEASIETEEERKKRKKEAAERENAKRELEKKEKEEATAKAYCEKLEEQELEKKKKEKEEERKRKHERENRLKLIKKCAEASRPLAAKNAENAKQAWESEHERERVGRMMSRFIKVFAEGRDESLQEKKKNVDNKGTNNDSGEKRPRNKDELDRARLILLAKGIGKSRKVAKVHTIKVKDY